jgi:hypothetical protein
MMFGRSLLVGAVAALLAVSAADGAEPISQFHLAPNDSAVTRVKFKAGKVYPMYRLHADDVVPGRVLLHPVGHPGLPAEGRGPEPQRLVHRAHG